MLEKASVWWDTGSADCTTPAATRCFQVVQLVHTWVACGENLT